MAKEYGDLPVSGTPFSRDIFADEAVGFEFLEERFTSPLAPFKMVEPIPPAGNQVVVIGRLVTIVPGAQRLALTLFDFFKKQGHDPAALVGSSDASNPNY